jgi:hypothetical protein
LRQVGPRLFIASQTLCSGRNATWRSVYFKDMLNFKKFSVVSRGLS